jgi:alkylation response protein AidB-like acyl-CoA dehydrogenase
MVRAAGGDQNLKQEEHIMNDYIAPIRDMKFALGALAGLDEIIALPGYEDCTPDLADAVLEEAGKLASDVLSPLNLKGDRSGAELGEKGVIATAGFADAYKAFAENGWCGLSVDPAHGGQGLPGALDAAVSEMWNSANFAFSLCPMLSVGAMEAIAAHGSEELKSVYLPRMASGEWTGTMNLTEPQAGSDLAGVRTRAVPEGDRYRIYGQKIFITWGDHDMTDNIVHLVLARLPDAPAGTRGISLFLVPKFLVNPDGTLGARNDVICGSLEHKLGIHGSPTCVMLFGEKDGAVGYLVGQANHGLAHMFTMMNEARQKVGIQGIGIAERAYQAARDYAKERVQGRPVGQKGEGRAAIIHHPDVRRMLMTMRSRVEAMRAFGYVVACDVDRAARHPDPEERRRRHARVELLTPVLKAWCTELGQEIASTGVQVHGGMGFIEETGAAQFLRDARISTIYEGTTGIQAADLVGRKLGRDKGEAMSVLIGEMRDIEERLSTANGLEYNILRAHLGPAIDALEQATAWVLETLERNPAAVMAASVNYLMLTGYVCGGWQMARAALAVGANADDRADDDFRRAKLTTAAFYAEQFLPQAAAMVATIRSGDSRISALREEDF